MLSIGYHYEAQQNYSGVELFFWKVAADSLIMSDQ